MARGPAPRFGRLRYARSRVSAQYEGRKVAGYSTGRTSWEVLANTIDLPVALRILAHLHGEIYPQWYDLAQVVDVQTKKAANLSIEGAAQDVRAAYLTSACLLVCISRV